MSSEVHSNPQKLVDHLFRHEAGKMIAVLTRVFGVRNLELVEDTVQETFLKALQLWKFGQLPDNPSAWLMRVARNRAIDLIRRQNKQTLLSEEMQSLRQSDGEEMIQKFFLDTEIADSQLRMIFTCCHPQLKPEDQIALTLKTVSGFGVQEIAHALVSNEAAIQKRLYRAKELIRENSFRFEIPVGSELHDRMDTVYTVLYLLFNEGYHSVKSDEFIRFDVCAEAMRLCKLLSEHPVGRRPVTFALLALMCFQASRFNSRIGDDNLIILLEQQDRRQWNGELIQMGCDYLAASAEGNELSVYHLEAAIAAEHSLSPDFQSTNWNSLQNLYDQLYKLKPIPVVQLSRAIVLSKTRGVPAAIDQVLDIPGLTDLIRHHYLYSMVLGSLYEEAGNKKEAVRLLQIAYDLIPSPAEKKRLGEKLSLIE